MTQPTSESKQLDGQPGGLGLILRAALPSLPVVGRLPGVRKAPASGFTGLAYTRPPVEVRRQHVEAYAAVCGFPVKDTVPVPYPHLLAFPLHMAILTDPAFPAPAVGTVHLENSLTSHRPVAVGERLALEARVGPGSAHPKGTTYEIRARALAGDELVWESVSTYLRRGRPPESGASAERRDGPSLTGADPSGLVWRLPGDLGRRYAAVSGDHNPIHLYPLTAKALGFPRQIAHGMWSLARCIAALENRLPDAVRVDVAFKKPILLPGSVDFGTTRTDDGYAFSLTSPKNGAPHVVGAATRPGG